MTLLALWLGCACGTGSAEPRRASTSVSGEQARGRAQGMHERGVLRLPVSAVASRNVLCDCPHCSLGHLGCGMLAVGGPRTAHAAA